MTAVDLQRNTTSRRIERKPGPVERNPRAFMRRRRIIDNLLRIGAPILLIVAWQLVVSTGLLDRRFWPAPTDVLLSFQENVATGRLAEALVSSMTRILLGYLIGSVAGILGGIALGVFRPLRIALEPIISAVYTVPKLAILPLLLLLFGLGDVPKIILIALGVFFVTIISTIAAVTSIPEGYLEPARSFGANRVQTFRHIIVPAIMPDIFVALRLAAGQAVLLMIGIEFVQGDEGLGYMIWNSWQLFLADRMYVGIVSVALVGVVFQTTVKWIGQRLTPWEKPRN
ncbi:ABC transporter permease [Arthrobacter sp. I2-34]|uniref:ABC transporter permease n=1 Tax=Arthrobacter hankyongi TaxID=2904801 RepID=A0ABS9L3X2_9MICC|nr:ABC transporter permease [Arthrobacter hankyongi]MCG2621313.1 ABC transporter permease [Arthrobacter hankyongi]